MIAVIDYGAGNVFNVLKACDYLGADARLTDDPQEILQADGIIFPGVGAFKLAMNRLQQRGLDQVLKQAVQAGIPLLGICLGMQMLFESSAEFGLTQGLGLIPGKVVQLPDDGLFIPQVGWNQNQLKQPSPLFQSVDQEYTYFVHSYYAQCPQQYVVASVDYGVPVPSIVQRGKVYGMQFHPEKSGRVGLKLLQSFFNETR